MDRASDKNFGLPRGKAAALSLSLFPSKSRVAVRLGFFLIVNFRNDVD